MSTNEAAERLRECEHQHVKAAQNWTDDGKGGTKRDGFVAHCDDCGVRFVPEAHGWNGPTMEERRLLLLRSSLDVLAHRDGDDCAYLYGRECDCSQPSVLDQKLKAAGILA